MTDNAATTSPPPLPGGQPAGYHRVAIPTTAATLAEHGGALQRGGFRLALVAAHDDRDTLRAVYLYTAADPDRRVELHLPVDRSDPAVPTLAGLSFPTVQGPGVYEIPVGPVHAGLIEPGHFRFSVVGETILKLKARLWYVHKGIEK